MIDINTFWVVATVWRCTIMAAGGDSDYRDYNYNVYRSSAEAVARLTETASSSRLSLSDCYTETTRVYEVESKRSFEFALHQRAELIERKQGGGK